MLSSRQMINYSIIIPHYNIPELLIRCVRSIPERDDVEIIVVDDHSPEGDKYPERYPELSRKGLTYIHLDKNIGGGGARNVGMKHASGKWLIFADADDFFNYCLDAILDEYKDNACDIIYLNANSIDTGTYLNTGRSEPQNKRIAAYLECANEDTDYDLRFSFGEPWCKIVSRQLVKEHNIEFEETPIHNDTQFSYLTGFYAKDITADMRAAYCLTDRVQSVSRCLDPDKYITRLTVFAKKYAFLQSNGIAFKDWEFIYNSVSFFQQHQLHEQLTQADNILHHYGIALQDVTESVRVLQKKDKRRRFKNKIIDRANIELKKLLFIKE